MKKSTNLAIAGYGLVGKRHVEVIARQPDLTLVAVVEPDASAAREIESMGARWFSSLDQMFASVDLDGIILSTPTPIHVEQGLTCIERKCPVLVEKPIAVTSREAAKLVDAAHGAEVPLLVGHHRRHNGMVRAAKAAIDNGVIGELRAVAATCWFYKPDSYFEQAPWRKKYGAGPVSVNLVHDIDLLRHFCGEVVKVQAQARPSRRGYENEDLASALLTFQSGALGTVSVSDSISAPWSWEMTSGENPAYPETSESCYLIGGSKASLSIPDLRVWQHEPSPDWWSPMTHNTLAAENVEPLSAQALHFARVINGEEMPLVSGLEGLRSLQVIEAIQQAAHSGKTVEIDQNNSGSNAA